MKIYNCKAIQLMNLADLWYFIGRLYLGTTQPYRQFRKIEKKLSLHRRTATVISR
jgi:hypothetical protein